MELSARNKPISYRNIETIFLAIISALCYYFFAYSFERTDFIELIALNAILFLSFLRLVTIQKDKVILLVSLAFAFRLILLIAEPNLSQDFYRFIWDGKLMVNGINPYLYSPNQIVTTGLTSFSNQHFLLEGMGSLSAGNLSNYPPLSQAYFWLCEVFSYGNIDLHIRCMRIILILTDLGIVLIGITLLKHLKIPAYTILYYILNPLIIIELTGNLHFEGLMLFFLLLSIYLYLKSNYLLASVLFSISISIKLFPLVLFPLLFKLLGSKRWLLHGLVIVIIQALSFLPFTSEELIQNFINTTGLWFQKFEFNASIYYLFRAIGYLVRGYNEIATIGKINILLVVGLTAYIAFFKTQKTPHSLFFSMLFVLSFFFFSATTVHPWYLATPLLLSTFTPYRYMLVWSFTVFMSYTAYSNPDFQENYFILFLEYAPVYILFFIELFSKKKPVEDYRPQQVHSNN